MNAEDYILRLNDGISGPAAAQTSALAQLEQQIAQSADASRELGAQMAILAASPTPDSGAIAALQSQIEATSASTNRAQAAFVSMGGSATSAANAAKVGMEGLAAAEKKAADAAAAAAKKTQGVGDAAGVTEGQMHALVSSAQVVGGSFGGLAGRAQQLITGLGKGGVAGVAILAAAALALLVVGIISATVELAKWAVGLADANRNQALATAGVAASSKELAGLAGILPNVQSATGLATAEITKLAEGLAAAGVKAADMPDALRAIATATAGGATSAFLEKLKHDLASGEKSARQLAQTVQQQFGGIVAQKMLSLDAQAAKFKQNISGIFGGLKIEGLLLGLSKLVSLFDANTASGKTMKFLFETMFQPLIDGAAAAIPYIEHAFITAAVWALKAYIALKPYSAELKVVGAALLLVAGVILGVFVVSILAVIATLGAVVGVIGAVVGAMLWLGQAIVGGVQSAISWLQSVDLGSIGSGMIGGLVNGILGGIGGVVAAMVALGGAAVAALKGALQSHSPSKLFHDIGEGGIAGGVAQGVDAGADDVNASVGDMVSTPKVKPTVAMKSGEAGAGKTLTFNNCSFGGDLNEGTLRAWMMGILEGEGGALTPAG